MRRLNVDREDDPAPGIRTFEPQDQRAKPPKGSRYRQDMQKVLAKHDAIRRPHQYGWPDVVGMTDRMLRNAQRSCGGQDIGNRYNRL